MANYITIDSGTTNTRISYVKDVRKGSDLLERQNVYAAEQTMTDADGNFSIQFVMPDSDRADSEKVVELGNTTYFAKAKELGITDKVLVRADSYLDEENALRLMYNVLFAPIIKHRQGKDSFKYIVTDDVLMMEEVYDLYKKKGIITENCITSFYFINGIEIADTKDIYVKRFVWNEMLPVKEIDNIN